MSDHDAETLLGKALDALEGLVMKSTEDAHGHHHDERGRFAAHGVGTDGKETMMDEDKLPRLTDRQVSGLRRVFRNQPNGEPLSPDLARQLIQKGLVYKVRDWERREWNKVIARLWVVDLTDKGKRVCEKLFGAGGPKEEAKPVGERDEPSRMWGGEKLTESEAKLLERAFGERGATVVTVQGRSTRERDRAEKLVAAGLLAHSSTDLEDEGRREVARYKTTEAGREVVMKIREGAVPDEHKLFPQHAPFDKVKEDLLAPGVSIEYVPPSQYGGQGGFEVRRDGTFLYHLPDRAVTWLETNHYIDFRRKPTGKKD